MTQTKKIPLLLTAGEVPAVVRASAILDLVAQSTTPITVSAISRELGLAKSTAHGLCNTMVGLNLLTRQPGGAFSLGSHLMMWANAFAARNDMVGSFLRLWEELPDLRHDTVTLSVLDGTDVTYIACREGNDPLGITFRIGMRLPAPFTATGKAMLSTYDRASIEQMFKHGLPEPMTPTSVRRLEDFLREIEATKQRGYSIDNGQVREGMFCFGAPIMGFASGRAIGGIAISVLEGDVTDEKEHVIGTLVRDCAERLSQRLGAVDSSVALANRS